MTFKEILKQQAGLKKILAPYGIGLMAWYPLGHGGQSLIEEPVFAELGKKYGKTSVQIVLRRHIQSGNVVIPGSRNPAHTRDFRTGRRSSTNALKKPGQSAILMEGKTMPKGEGTMTICYFTATGNSLYVAKRIGGELISIPKLMKTDHIEITDDAVGIVCPVYAGEMPGMVRRFMTRATIRANYLFFVYTFGMSETVARPNAMAAAKAAELALDYVGTVRMVDNYLPGFEAQNQIDTAGAKNIEGQIDRVCGEIAARKKNAAGVNPLQRIEMAVIHGTMGRFIFDSGAARKYIVNDSCVRYGICAKVCPADNIAVTDKVVFADRCEVCYACLHNCPKNAIHLKSEKSAARFRNEHVTLNEIIGANG